MSAVWIRLQRNWFRNLLAVVQVAIAIAAVTAVLVDVAPVLFSGGEAEAGTYVARFGAQRGGAVMWSSVFTPDDAEYLMEQGTTIEAASAFDRNFEPVIVVDGERWMVRGGASVHPGFAQLMNLELVAGAFFTEQDVQGTSPRVAVISRELAEFLFGAVDVVGRVVNLRPADESVALRGFSPPERLAEALAMPGDDVEIVGVFEATDLMTMLAFGPSVELLLPVMTGDTQGRSAPYAEIFFRAREGMDREAEEEVRRLLMSRLAQRGDDQRTMDGMSLEVLVTPVAAGAQLRQARLLSALILGGLGLAALVVSSIAVFTTTLANLAPRTRYIGLSRALGATRSRIVKEVVLESALLAGVGGVLGAVTAFPLRRTIFSPLFATLPGEAGPAMADLVLAGVAGVALAVAVGAVAALYPAWTVARLAPAAAWREGMA